MSQYYTLIKFVTYLIDYIDTLNTFFYDFNFEGQDQGKYISIPP